MYHIASLTDEYLHFLTDVFLHFITDADSLEGLGRYMLKAAAGSRRCSSSLNLADPIITRSMSRMSRRRVSQLADWLRYDGKAILEQVYPGYMFVELQVRRSDFVSGANVYAKMRKLE